MANYKCIMNKYSMESGKACAWNESLVSECDSTIKLSRETFLEANLSRHVRKGKADEETKQQIESYLTKYDDVDLKNIFWWVRTKSLTISGRKDVC